MKRSLALLLTLCLLSGAAVAEDIATPAPTAEPTAEPTPEITVEPVAELLKSMQRYDEQSFITRFTLGMVNEQGARKLESTLVQPFARDELTQAAYPCVLYTHRYLTTSLTETGVVWVVVPDELRDGVTPRNGRDAGEAA